MALARGSSRVRRRIFPFVESVSLMNRSLSLAACSVALALPLALSANLAHAAAPDVHGGLDLRAAAQQMHPHYAEAVASDVPASFSLQQYAPTPANQGNNNSCVTWATGYTGYSILMNEAKRTGAPMAPMYIYSQIVANENGGEDKGTTADVALGMEQEQGIDTQADYVQGTQDFVDQPTDSERANAAKYKLGASRDLLGSSDVQASIEQAISEGKPVVIGVAVRSSIRDLNASNSDYEPSADEQVLFGHEMTIVGYDENGVTVENSWGTGWGNGGFFTTSWDFLLHSGDVKEIHAMDSLAS